MRKNNGVLGGVKQAIMFTVKVSRASRTLITTEGYQERVSELRAVCPAVYVLTEFFEEMASNVIDANRKKPKAEYLMEVSIIVKKGSTTVQVMNNGQGFPEDILKIQDSGNERNYCNYSGRGARSKIASTKANDLTALGGEGKGLAWAANTLEILSGRLYVGNARSGAVITMISPNTVSQADILTKSRQEEYFEWRNPALRKAIEFFGDTNDIVRTWDRDLVAEGSREVTLATGLGLRYSSASSRSASRPISRSSPLLFSGVSSRGTPIGYESVDSKRADSKRTDGKRVFKPINAPDLRK